MGSSRGSDPAARMPPRAGRACKSEGSGGRARPGAARPVSPTCLRAWPTQQLAPGGGTGAGAPRLPGHGAGPATLTGTRQAQQVSRAKVGPASLGLSAGAPDCRRVCGTPSPLTPTLPFPHYHPAHAHVTATEPSLHVGWRAQQGPLPAPRRPPRAPPRGQPHAVHPPSWPCFGARAGRRPAGRRIFICCLSRLLTRTERTWRQDFSSALFTALPRA